MSSTRRQVLKTLAASAVVAPAFLQTVNAQGLRKTSFTLSWLPEGWYAWAFVTRAKGFWRDQGLDVDIARGTGSLTAAQAVAAGRFEFGVTNSSAAILVAAQGQDIRSLAMCDYNSMMGVAVLDDSPIRTPKDLEGKVIGQTLASSDAAFFKPFCAANGVNMDGMHLLNLDARLRNQSLVAKKADAITGFASSIVATVESNGQKVRMLNYSDYGVSVYGDICMMTQPDRVAKDPDLCRRFTAGLLNGMKFTLTHPEEAEQIFLDEVPENKMNANSRSYAHLGMAIQRYGILASDDPKTHSLGWSDPVKLDQAIDFIMKYQAGPNAKRPDAKTIFLNDFVGNVALSPDEWEKARAATSFIGEALGRKI